MSPLFREYLSIWPPLLAVVVHPFPKHMSEAATAVRDQHSRFDVDENKKKIVPLDRKFLRSYAQNIATDAPPSDLLKMREGIALASLRARDMRLPSFVARARPDAGYGLLSFLWVLSGALDELAGRRGRPRGARAAAVSPTPAATLASNIMVPLSSSSCRVRALS